MPFFSSIIYQRKNRLLPLSCSGCPPLSFSVLERTAARALLSIKKLANKYFGNKKRRWRKSIFNTSTACAALLMAAGKKAPSNRCYYLWSLLLLFPAFVAAFSRTHSAREICRKSNPAYNCILECRAAEDYNFCSLRNAHMLQMKTSHALCIGKPLFSQRLDQFAFGLSSICADAREAEFTVTVNDSRSVCFISNLNQMCRVWLLKLKKCIHSLRCAINKCISYAKSCEHVGINYTTCLAQTLGEWELHKILESLFCFTFNLTHWRIYWK